MIPMRECRIGLTLPLLHENGFLVTTPTALFAGSVGLSRPGKIHGSQSAPTVATDAIFIRGDEPDKIIGYSDKNGFTRTIVNRRDHSITGSGDEKVDPEPVFGI